MSEASPAYQRHSMMRPGQMFADQADVCWPCQAASRKLGCWFSVRLGIKQSRYWDKEAEWNMACCLVLTTMSWLLSIFHTVACEDDDLMQCRWVINILWQRPGGQEGPVIVTHIAQHLQNSASPWLHSEWPSSSRTHQLHRRRSSTCCTLLSQR